MNVLIDWDHFTCNFSIVRQANNKYPQRALKVPTNMSEPSLHSTQRSSLIDAQSSAHIFDRVFRDVSLYHIVDHSHRVPVEFDLLGHVSLTRSCCACTRVNADGLVCALTTQTPLLSTTYSSAIFESHFILRS